MSIALMRGLYPLWFKEKGCSMYMGFGVIALLLTSILILSGEKNMSVVFAAFVALSSGAGFVWQMIKLSADETASLVPNKTTTVLRQGTVLLTSITGIFVLVCVISLRFDALKSFAFGALCALGIAIKCSRDPQFFKHITSIYLVASVLVHFIAFIPDWVYWSVWTICFTVLIMVSRQLNRVQWSATAFTVYHDGLRSGWSPLSQQAKLPAVLNFEKRLFPFSLIAGKSLPSFMYLIAGLTLLIPLFAYLTPWFTVYLFGIMVTLPMFVLYTRWSMLHASRTLDTVYLLPVFSSKTAIKKKIVDQFLMLASGLVTVLWLVATISGAFSGEASQLMSLMRISAICLALLSGLLTLFAIANYFTNVLTYSFVLAFAMNGIFMIISILMFNIEPKLKEIMLLLTWLGLSIGWNYLSIKSWCKEP